MYTLSSVKELKNSMPRIKEELELYIFFFILYDGLKLKSNQIQT